MPTGPQILIATGGTGGHLFPAFAVAEEIERRWPTAQVTLTTGSRDIEREVCESAGRKVTPLPLAPAAEAKTHPLKFARALWSARRMAVRLIAESRPDVVVGTGGFTMTPVVHTALRAKIPVVLLEQNVIPGRATRWYARSAAAVCSSFEQIQPPLNGATISVTGNPVRASIAAMSITEARPRETILILGGSQGARALNESLGRIAEASPGLLSVWTVVHQTGGEESARLLSDIYQQNGIRAEVRPFFDRMADEYARAGLVVARAGATTLAELACAAVPAILVPYPYSRDGHQHANAEVFSKRAAALVVEQAAEIATTAERIGSAIESLASEESRRVMSRQMRALARPDAAERVVEAIAKLVQ